MTGEVAVGGVFFPILLLLYLAALPLSWLIVRLLGLTSFYRFFAYRAIVDLSILVLVLGGLVFLSIYFGFQP